MKALFAKLLCVFSFGGYCGPSKPVKPTPVYPVMNPVLRSPTITLEEICILQPNGKCVKE